jgi:hypothetical protein
MINNRNDRRTKTLTVLLLATFLVATSTPGQAQRLWETRVLNDRCPTEPPPDNAPLLLALGTFLIPKLVDFGVSLANQSLQNKKAEETAKNDDRFADGVGVVEAFYEDREFQGKPITHPALDKKCMIVVRGDFGRPDSTPFDTEKCNKFKEAGLEKQNSCDWLRKIGVSDIGIYMEAKYVFSEDALSFRLQPNHLAFIRPIKSSKAPTDGTNDDGSGFYDLTYTTTYESSSSGQSTVSFAMAVLAFEQLKPQTVLTGPVLAGKSSGWTVTMPVVATHAAEIQKISALYDRKKDAEDKVKALPAQIAASEKKVREAADALLKLFSRPALNATQDALKEGAALANQTIAGEDFDDVILVAKLDGDPNTNPSTGDAAQAPKKRIARQQAMRANANIRSKATELKTMAEAGLKLRSDLEQANKDLTSTKTETAAWAAKTHGSGPANVKVGLKEKPHLPTNIFLLTAADAFASSKSDISQFVSSNLLQTLNLQDKSTETQKLSDQASLVIGANTALNAAKAAETDLNNLSADAPEQTKRDKATAFENAKIAANVAFVKACQPAPYPGSYGGNLTLRAC